MQTTKILDKLITYAIYTNANTIDIDYEFNNLSINIIKKHQYNNFFISDHHAKPLIDILKSDYSKPKKYSFNNLSYNLNTQTFQKNSGIRFLINISRTPFRPIILENIGFNQTQLNTINQNISTKAKLNLIIGPLNSGLTTTLYSIANHANAHTKNIYLIENSSKLHLEGISQIHDPFNKSSKYKNILSAINKQNPDLLLLDKPNLDIIRDSINLAFNGTPITITFNSDSITEALTTIIKSNIDAKILRNTLNLIIFQNKNSNNHYFKTFTCNNILKNTLTHPRLSKTLIKRAVNQNILPN